jgi:hypothetical protein
MNGSSSSLGCWTQQNGRHERMHFTLKLDGPEQKAAADRAVRLVL